LKKLAYLAGVAGLGLIASVALLLHSRTSFAADHGDADSLATNAAADITDLFAWTNANHTRLNLVMDVSPNAAAGDHFSTSVLYVFHVQAFAAYGMAPTVGPTNIICKFASDTSVECWVGTSEYVTGDPSDTAGLDSADGKVKVFAGQRNDPFFFNLHGFANVVAEVDAAEPTLPPDDGHGCYDLGVTGPVLVADLAKDTNGVDPGTDTFAGQNVNAIVLQVDTTLLNGGGPILGVWASTNEMP
jgi:Domain of unknown function (DUF4331)